PGIRRPGADRPDAGIRGGSGHLLPSPSVPSRGGWCGRPTAAGLAGLAWFGTLLARRLFAVVLLTVPLLVLGLLALRLLDLGLRAWVARLRWGARRCRGRLAVRSRRAGLARPLILLEAGQRCAGTVRPEDEERKSVQRYLRGPGDDSNHGHGDEGGQHLVHGADLPALCAAGLGGRLGGRLCPALGARPGTWLARRVAVRLGWRLSIRLDWLVGRGGEGMRASPPGRGDGGLARAGEVLRDVLGHSAQFIRHGQDGRA